MMHAQRSACRHISILLHEGANLSAAIFRVQSDSMFWLHEVYEHMSTAQMASCPPPKRAKASSPSPCTASKGVDKSKTAGRLDTFR
eukprot:4161577-Amphidinium_carterae.1